MIEWLKIPNYEAYEINIKGEIRRNNKLLKFFKNTAGYFKVNLSINGNVKTIMVHQLMALTYFNDYKLNNKNIVIDHIDNNKLNNNLYNLRLISFRENVTKDRISSSKYPGVSWNKTHKKWYSYINLTGKNKYLGRFDNEKDAALAYSNALNEKNIEK